MASTNTRRIQKELGELQNSPINGVDIQVDESDVTKWKVVMKGPEGTPYQGGIFHATIDFSDGYPFKAPKFQFKTKMYHPNVDGDGNVCVGILKTENWKPASKISGVLQALYDLIRNPNPDDPLVTSIAEQYNNDRAQFDKIVKEYVNKYAK